MSDDRKLRHDPATFNEVNALINRDDEGRFVPFSQRLAITNRFLDWHYATPALFEPGSVRAIHEEAQALETSDSIANLIEEAADELEPPFPAEWVDLFAWFKVQLHTLAAQAREAGGHR